MVADQAKAIAPLTSPPKPLTSTVMGPLKRSPLSRLGARRWAVIGLVLLISAGGVLALRRGGGSNRDISAYTTTVERGQLDGVITASGEIAAERSVNVSPKRAGQLQELLVKEGDKVRAGQLLARMDPDDTNSKVAELQAQVEVAQVEVQKTRVEYERRANLYAQGGLSTDDYLQYQARYLSSQAQLRAAMQRLEQSKVDRNDLLVKAPFAGTITNRFADPGSYVTPTTSASTSAGASSASIVELASGLEAKAKVPESDIGRIATGQKAEVRVDAYPDKRFAARVSSISPRAKKTNDVTTVEVTLKLLNPPEGKLRIGMTADIDFDSGKLPPEPLVPTVAIVTEEGKPGVLIPGSGNQPRFQEVTLGNSSGRQTQVLEGVKPGEKVFIDLPPWASKRSGN